MIVFLIIAIILSTTGFIVESRRLKKQREKKS